MRKKQNMEHKQLNHSLSYMKLYQALQRKTESHINTRENKLLHNSHQDIHVPKTLPLEMICIEPLRPKECSPPPLTPRLDVPLLALVFSSCVSFIWHIKK